MTLVKTPPTSHPHFHRSKPHRHSSNLSLVCQSHASVLDGSTFSKLKLNHSLQHIKAIILKFCPQHYASFSSIASNNTLSDRFNRIMCFAFSINFPLLASFISSGNSSLPSNAFAKLGLLIAQAS